VSAPFRNTVTHKWKGDWKEESFKTATPTQPLYLSGHTFYSGNGEVMLTDKTVPDTAQELEKSLICGEASDGAVDLTVNGESRHFKATKKVNRILIDTSSRHNLDVIVSNSHLPVYGVTIEPRSGVVVDNFSFRGITGLELAKLDSDMLRELESENNYDLVVLEYGANLMFRPDDVDYSWYRRHIISVVSRLHKAMPHTEFLVVSTADRAFNYASKWRTATGIDNLVKTQAETAYRNNAAFFNLYQSMGGPGTMVRWADSSPALANKDYVHPNFLGADALGNMLYEAFMKDFRKASGNAGL
jgi:lysophospholipase L1-like esterase